MLNWDPMVGPSVQHPSKHQSESNCYLQYHNYHVLQEYCYCRRMGKEQNLHLGRRLYVKGISVTLSHCSRGKQLTLFAENPSVF